MRVFIFFYILRIPNSYIPKRVSWVSANYPGNSNLTDRGKTGKFNEHFKRKQNAVNQRILSTFSIKGNHDQFDHHGHHPDHNEEHGATHQSVTTS